MSRHDLKITTYIVLQVVVGTSNLAFKAMHSLFHDPRFIKNLAPRLKKYDLQCTRSNLA